MQNHFQQVLAERESAGDPSVAVHRYQIPWSAEGLGPKRCSPALHRALGNLCLADGKRGEFAPNDAPIRWVEGRPRLTELFLEALEDQGGRGWQDFVTALQAAWECNRQNEWLENNVGAPSLIDRLLLPSESTFDRQYDLDANQTWTVGHDKAVAAFEETWKEAFASGQIFVFRCEDSAWRYLPPHRWIDRPPFSCLQIEDLTRNWQRDEDAERLAEAAARRRRAAVGITYPSDRDLFATIGMEPVIGECTDLTVCAEAVDLDRYAFLLSRDLDDLNIDAGRATDTLPPGQGREFSKGRPSFANADQPLVEEGLQRLKAGEFQSISAAVNKMHLEDARRFAGGGTDESKIARIRKAIGDHYKKLAG